MAKQLKNDYAKAFDLLTTFPLKFYDEGSADHGEYIMGLSAPMIK